MKTFFKLLLLSSSLMLCSCGEDIINSEQASPELTVLSKTTADNQEQQQFLVKLDIVEKSVSQLEKLAAAASNGVVGAVSSLETQAGSLAEAAAELTEEDLEILASSDENIEERVNALQTAINVILDDPVLSEILTVDQLSSITQTLTAVVEENLGPVISYFGYEIGDIGPAGGFIFYDDEDDGVDDIPGIRYLEAAPKSTEFYALFGRYPHNIPGANGTELGTGAQNTADIVNAYPSEDYAANLCDRLVYGGYDDWFLPSLEECKKMYVLKRMGLGDFGGVNVDNSHWMYLTSTEVTVYYFLERIAAWYVMFTYGGATYDYKYRAKAARAIRAF